MAHVSAAGDGSGAGAGADTGAAYVNADYCRVSTGMPARPKAVQGARSDCLILAVSLLSGRNAAVGHGSPE